MAAGFCPESGHGNLEHSAGVTAWGLKRESEEGLEGRVEASWEEGASRSEGIREGLVHAGIAPYHPVAQEFTVLQA